MSVKSALAKLDELQERTEMIKCACLLDEKQVRICIESYFHEILVELGKDDSKQFDNKYECLVHDIRMINKRLEAIESKCSCKVKFKENIERRISDLEESFGKLFELPEAKVDGVCPEAKEYVYGGHDFTPKVDNTFTLSQDKQAEPFNPVSYDEYKESQNHYGLNEPSAKVEPTITISRKVAENWFRIMKDVVDDNDGCIEAWDLDLYNQISQAIKQKE